MSKYQAGDKVWTHVWEEFSGTNVANGQIRTIRKTILGPRYFVEYINYEGDSKIRPRMWWRIWL